MPPYQQPITSPSPPPLDSTDAAAAALPPVPQLSLLPPPPREVASGLSNLGNTCYINAAMQALAHAPELCTALDIESHIKECPIAKRNEVRRRRRFSTRHNAMSSDSDSSHSSSLQKQTPPTAATKSKKKRRRAAPVEENALPYDPNLQGDTEDEFCTLCEVERLLGRVHSRSPDLVSGLMPTTTTNGSVEASGGPVVPETFTAGFMGHVAPWFRRGVQEDSHEFLRLLIDAMQNSCKAARNSGGGDDAASPTNANKRQSCSKNTDQDDVEYPFRLFRGTVESNVTCSACRAVSCKIDPIEDIGLDILPVKKAGRHPAPAATYRSTTSRSTSPNNASTPLAAIPEALERFTSIEHLDAGYKCEKCGKVGKATKTSRLASIPPILTLHLKRFRYGSILSSGANSRSRGISESGPSGSAKIEGHVGFTPILDIKPYLTAALKESTFKKAFCRLFAVVVHNGKNSHSGHYVAYVQSLNSKEWWKMDDAKVSRASVDEVLGCEAYMLFYRVVDHPVSKSLAEIAGRKAAEEKRVREEMERVIREAEERAKEEESRAKSSSPSSAVTTAAGEVNIPKEAEEDEEVALGKRKRPELASGEEWAKALTSLPPSYYPLLQQIQDYISENVTFCPEFFTYIQQECNRMSSKLGGKQIKTLLGKGPKGVYPPEDVQEEARDVRDGILDLFHMISIIYKKDGKGNGFLLPKPAVEEVTSEIVPVVSFPVMSDQELIIPEPGEGFDGYDGAL